MRTLARTLPDGNGRKIAMLAVGDIEDLIAALREGEIEPREVPA